MLKNLIAGLLPLGLTEPFVWALSPPGERREAYALAQMIKIALTAFCMTVSSQSAVRLWSLGPLALVWGGEGAPAEAEAGVPSLDPGAVAAGTAALANPSGLTSDNTQGLEAIGNLASEMEAQGF